MTGSPLLRLLLVLAGLALLTIPAWQLTGRETPAAIPSPGMEKNQNTTAEIELTFTSPIPPSLIIVEADGLKIAESRPESSQTSLKAPVHLPSEGVDLVVKATWPDPSAKNNALRVQVSLNGTSPAETTLWGSPNVEDVITLPGAPKP